PAPAPVETVVSETVNTAADTDANNSIQNNQATIVVETPTLFRTFSLEFMNNVNTTLESITLGNQTAQVTLPKGVLNNTAAAKENIAANENFTVEVATVPVAKAQQNAGQGITVISAVQVNLNVVNEDGTSSRISELGAPVSLQLNVGEYFQNLGLTTDAQRQAYIRENNVMVAFITPSGAQNYYPVTYSNGVVTANGITHFSTYAVVEAKNVRVVRMTIDKLNTNINNDTRIVDVPPMIIENRTMVPLRFIGEAIGGNVEWVDATRTVKVTTGDKTVSLIIGQTGAGLDVPAQIVDSRTLVPVRYISEQLGAKVNWTELTRTVEIIK
ncbi:MAG: copper amine oxidase N-terminal domain-containing protein, partial [Eubacteriales bacterium]|nr:copper amine oxidase N-terminal domain-containing protein [Eubacteriales bacterium]